VADGGWYCAAAREDSPIVARKIVLALVVFILLLLGLNVFNGCASPVLSTNIELKAVIIDQLNPTNPNPDFITRATAILENNGFKVDYFSAEAVTLELYRQLPASGFSLIIFRSHSGLLGNGTKADQKTCLFSNQPYRQTNELGDQLFDRVVKARVDNGPPLFGIGADFVSRSMRGQLNKTTVIMMGCSSFEKDDLAQAFIEKGAAVYCGWNTEVKLNYDEDVTLKLLDSIFELKSVEAAVQATMQEKGPDPDTGAELKCLNVVLSTTKLH
jgi:hypothetical protein